MAKDEKIFLSIIICVHNMSREAPRTILSALPPYQINVGGSEYELIVVDNGSSKPMDAQFLITVSEKIKYVQFPGESVSPVFALNWAAHHVAKGNRIMFCIDGARLFSEGLVASCLKYTLLNEQTLVYTLGWHLGPKVQTLSSVEGYNEDVEDRLLDDIDWYNHPEKLFRVSALAGSCANGFFSSLPESNAFVVSRLMLEQNGGFDERFTSAGGGLANLEIFARYVTNRLIFPVCLLADGTFHQYHGGIATSNKVTWDELVKEYASIFGKSYSPPVYETMYAGTFRKEASAFYLESLQKMNFSIL